MANNQVDAKSTRKIGKVIVDRQLCIGAASCVALAPKAFALDEKDKAVVRGTWTEEDVEMLIAAAKSCPVNAIIIEDETGRRIWPPE